MDNRWIDMGGASIEHFGRLGMHWGRHIFGDDPRWGKYGRNKKGKKLSRKQKKLIAQNLEKARKAKEDRKKYEADKEKAVKSGSASDVLKYKGDLTQEQMNSALSRLQWEANISRFSTAEVSKGQQIINNLDKMTTNAEKGIKAYNMVANVMNSVAGTELRTISTDFGTSNRRALAEARKAEAEASKAWSLAKQEQIDTERKAWDLKEDKKGRKKAAKK